MQIPKQNNSKFSKITAMIYIYLYISTDIRVYEAKLKVCKDKKSSPHPCEELREYYKNITEEGQQLAITSTCDTTLKNSINIKEYINETLPGTITEVI